jgi:hypothetical protein
MIHVSYTIQLSYIQVDTSIYIYKISYEFPLAVLVLGVCNHIAQETRSYDHQEYGTIHTAIYIHA